MLRLCMTGKLRCIEKTRRPSTATVSAVTDILDGGDFYPHEAIAAFAWPMLLQAGGLAARPVWIQSSTAVNAPCGSCTWRIRNTATAVTVSCSAV
ncbi:hypothetical protein [Streptomyces sviceus]|uniref:hypothetical protein n=1 Tax=Streptomyces sviceus TaxID=285530 RepID=UPI0036E73F45